MRTGKDLFTFSVWSDYSVVENWLGGQPRNTPNTRNEDQGMRTREDLFSFSVWSECSVVEKMARWSTTEHTEHTEMKTRA
jgi:hypothetical protein